jgi:hypothetical protein
VVFGVTAEARGNSTAVDAFLGGYGAGGALDSGTQRLWDGPFLAPTAGTLDGWLLDTWHAGTEHYDALFLQNLTSASEARTLKPLRPRVPLYFATLLWSLFCTKGCYKYGRSLEQ